jgi:hypothetical protein
MNPFAKLKAPQNKDEGRTFDDWKNDGYSVMRGETATGRNADGVPTFTYAQVTETGNFDNDDSDYDHPMESVLQVGLHD